MPDLHWPTFLRELQSSEDHWRNRDVKYPREDAVPWMPFPLAQFSALLLEAVSACSRPYHPLLQFGHGPAEGLMFLDVGCGPGTKCRLARELYDLDVYGIDIVPRFVGEAQAHHIKATVQDAFEYKSYKRFDIVLVNRPSGLQDELENLIMREMDSDAVLIAVNWRNDPAKQGWTVQFQEYGEPVCGVFVKS